MRTCCQGLFKKVVQQGSKQRGGRGVLGSTLSPPSNENAAGGLFQQSLSETTTPSRTRMSTKKSCNSRKLISSAFLFGKTTLRRCGVRRDATRLVISRKRRLARFRATAFPNRFPTTMHTPLESPGTDKRTRLNREVWTRRPFFLTASMSWLFFRNRSRSGVTRDPRALPSHR